MSSILPSNPFVLEGDGSTVFTVIAADGHLGEGIVIVE
jgi:hypothetical protein